MTSVRLSFGARTSVAMPLTPPASARFPYQVGREPRAVDHSSLRRARECSMSTTVIGMRGTFALEQAICGLCLCASSQSRALGVRDRQRLGQISYRCPHEMPDVHVLIYRWAYLVLPALSRISIVE